ncbi:unnamed protein product, partial [Choristocarpus tenellus]
FCLVQKEFPGRNTCELVDRYYGGWKKTEWYVAAKNAIITRKLQSRCWICQEEGDLLCCDSCDGVYHLKCLRLSVVPDGDWFCPDCI